MFEALREHLDVQVEGLRGSITPPSGALVDLLGELESPVASCVSALGRLGTAGHRRRRVAGVLTAVAVPTAWLVLLWAGFALMFLSDDDAVLVSASQQPVGALGRVAYAAGGLAGAGAGLIAGTETWQLVNNVSALFGLALVTMSLTYLMQVISAVSTPTPSRSASARTCWPLSVTVA